jgi:O-acetyl-ADP-ribose deacetylase
MYPEPICKTFENRRTLRLVAGDITMVAADAIVNAANYALVGGGGVDGAIHHAGGPSLMLELDRIRAAQGGCPTGGAVATSAGSLPAKYVFHAVGPVYRDGLQNEPRLLASCYEVCFDLAEERSVRTISFPAISTGAYAYPIRDAAKVALATISKRLRNPQTSLQEAIVVLFDAAAFRVYQRLLLE